MELNFLINSINEGGAEKQLRILSENLKYRSLFTLEKSDYELSSYISLSNHKQKTSPIIKTLYIPIYSKKISKHLGKNDVLISFMTRANLVNIISSKKSGHKAIISERTNPTMEFTSIRSLYLNLIRRYYNKADYILTNSNGTKKELIDNYYVNENKIKVIENHLDMDYISKSKNEELGEFKKIFEYPILVNLGRLNMSKGQWNLIKIFHHLKKINKDLKLVFLGEGELKEDLISLARRYQLKVYTRDMDISENFDVYFLGFQNNPYKFLRKSKLYLCSSIWESFPNAILEAMACSIPVISSNCRYGPLEIFSIKADIGDYDKQIKQELDFGILMPMLEKKINKKFDDSLNTQEKLWIETILEMLSDPHKRDLYKGLSFARANDFSLKKIMPKWLNFIESIR